MVAGDPNKGGDPPTPGVPYQEEDLPARHQKILVDCEVCNSPVRLRDAEGVNGEPAHPSCAGDGSEVEHLLTGGSWRGDRNVR